ncbi:MAG: phytanoyl-CoA dioxygenase family protein [Planctomycetes bacterium]|nr:phytanoyl-CoA dioxygenase family protein [Planctomycetota bacterium]
MTTTKFTPEELDSYHRDGYLLSRGLFHRSEIEKLLAFAQSDPSFQQSVYGRKDAEGKTTRLALWNEAGDSLYSMFSRSPRILGRMTQILGGEVYHYHTKMMLKEPRVGGAWEWHQDYGYWYHNGCLAPLLASCLIAVSPSTRANGCLQVLRGSHALGRIDHGRTGEQTGAEMERVEVALQRHELIHVEASPGDALFFHCNLLHRSDANYSDDPRWSLICCYNAARNDPYKESRHPRYSRLEPASNEAIEAWSPPAGA